MSALGMGIAGLQETQDAMLRTLAATETAGARGRAVQHGLARLHRHLVAITHVDTGAYRASHRAEMEGAAQGRLFVDPSARNPRSGELVRDYAPVEEARGGSHAAYARTVAEIGDEVSAEMAEMIARAM